MNASSARATSMPPIRLGMLGYGLDRPLTGIGRYAVELTQHFSTSDELAVTLMKPFAQPVTELEPRVGTSRIHGRLLPSYMLAGPAQITAIARKRRLNVIHDPFGVSPFFAPRSIGRFGRVVTIHDMIPFVFPETHAPLTNLLFRRYIPWSLRFVDRIITDSESSRRDIVRFYRFPADRVHAIPIGVSHRFVPATREATQRALDRYGITTSYIMVVGSLNPRKNLETLFESYRLLRQRGLGHQLVVVGPKAWKSASIFQRLHDLGLESDVVMTGFVDEDDLPALYSGADAFAFPSLYEGFGLPPLEAMACGTPVVTSNSSSLPEVVGGAGLMIDPGDAKALADAIEHLVTDRATHAKFAALGLARAKQFRWDRTACAHLNLYREIAP